jgi:hypothetical protein
MSSWVVNGIHMKPVRSSPALGMAQSNYGIKLLNIYAFIGLFEFALDNWIHL